MNLDINLFDYDLPEGRVALYPVEPRDSSRMLYLPRRSGQMRHLHFTDFTSFLRAGDVLVLNDSRVFPARLHGRKKGSGGQVEVFLLERLHDGSWEALVRPGRRLPPGAEVVFSDRKLSCILGDRTPSGGRVILFDANGDLHSMIWKYGEVPLPPYIDRPVEEEDKERYQTVYAEKTGAVAAPTAGFHFTESILNQVRGIGVEIIKLTLHPGLGTFRPVTRTDIEKHRMHPEKFAITSAAASAVNTARKEGRRIIAVGTTSVRALESSCGNNGMIESSEWRSTELFIRPGYEFKVVDGMLTNFHLPKSTLLLLVSAMAGRERILAAYKEAIDKGYRFYSYGDAMLIL